MKSLILSLLRKKKDYEDIPVIAFDWDKIEKGRNVYYKGYFVMRKDFFKDIIVWEQYKFPENTRFKDSNYIFKNIRITSSTKMTNMFKDRDNVIYFDFISEEVKYTAD